MSREDARPRVLFLTTRDVARPRTGADNRAAYLYEGLDEAMGADIVSFDRSDGEADAVGTSVPYPPSELLAIVSVRFARAVVRTLRRGEYDVVVASGIGAVLYGVLASVLGRAPLVFDDHNVEYELARDASLPRFVVVYLLERLACWRAALLVVPTSAVATTLRPWTDGAVTVVTNGYDASTFSPDGEATTFEGVSLLYFGNFGYGPNVEALEYILERLAPRLADEADVRILLAGPGLDTVVEPSRLPEGVESLGFVEDLPATIRGVDLVVVPLRRGSGSRLKIIESLACGTKVVSTPTGAEGWPDDWANLLLADLETFPDAVLDALEDPSFDRSEDEAVARYSWGAQSERLVSAVRDVIDQAR